MQSPVHVMAFCLSRLVFMTLNPELEMIDPEKYVSEGSERTFADGQTLIEQSEATGRVHLLRSGCVEVFRDGSLITTVDEPGAPFGEIAAILDTPHQATVRAKGEVSVIEIEDFEALARREPGLLLEVTEVLAKRLLATNALLSDARQEFENLLETRGSESEEARNVKAKIRAAWERFGELMRVEIADF